jgi:hypothetical protein
MKKRTTTRSTPVVAKVNRATKSKPGASEMELADHNRLLAILGLPPVRAPLSEGPSRSPIPRARKGSPLASLDKFYGGEGPTAPRGRFIHWWGQFSDEPPAPFTLKHGGHGYLEARDVEHATHLLAKLRTAVQKMKPDPSADDEEDIEQYGLKATREWAGISDRGMAWYRWMRTDGSQMTVELRLAITKRELAGERLVKVR